LIENNECPTCCLYDEVTYEMSCPDLGDETLCMLREEINQDESKNVGTILLILVIVITCIF
jgi:hypothetical protein